MVVLIVWGKFDDLVKKSWAVVQRIQPPTTTAKKYTPETANMKPIKTKKDDAVQIEIKRDAMILNIFVSIIWIP